jgi:hypothetical protein
MATTKTDEKTNESQPQPVLLRCQCGASKFTMREVVMLFDVGGKRETQVDRVEAVCVLCGRSTTVDEL